MIDDADLVPRLLESGVIDQDRLREGIDLAKSTGNSLYNALITQKLVEEKAIVDIVAGVLRLPSVQLERLTIEQSVLDLVPASMAKRNRVVPLQVRDESGNRQLVLGMTDPIDVLAMDEIATHTGIDIRPVLVGPADLTAFLELTFNPAPRDPELDLLEDLDELAVDVLEDESWAAFFDDAQSLEFEDSASISQEMRDRPASGVFDSLEPSSADDVPSLDALEDMDLDIPIEGPSDLDDWEIDDAITSRKDGGVKHVPQKAQILSAYAAKSLFDDEEGGGEASIAAPLVEDSDPDLDEPTERKSLEELSGSLAEDSSVENTGRTSIGLGIEEIAEEGATKDAGSMSVGGKRKKEAASGNTDSLRAEDPEDPEDPEEPDTGSSKTQAGVGSRAISKKIGKVKGKNKNTDYGALGRMILKTGDEEDEEDEEGAEEQDPAEPGRGDENVDTGVHKDGADSETGVHEKNEKNENKKNEKNQSRSLKSDGEPTTGIREADIADAVDTGVHKKAVVTSVHKRAVVEDDPKTRDVPSAAEVEQDGNVTRLGFLGPNTREIDEDDLFAIAGAGAGARGGLSEDTAAAEGDQQRLLAAELSFADDDQNHRATKSHPVIRPQDLMRGGTHVGTPQVVAEPTRPSAAQLAVMELKLDLPEGVSERALLMATLKILISQGICDLETVIALAKDASE